MQATKDTLLLNADHTPLQILDWQRAVWLLLTERVRPVESYANRWVRAESVHVGWPAVVALWHQAPMDPGGVSLSRANLLARDRCTCQYCGLTAPPRPGRTLPEGLTLDHVIPRAQARRGQVELPDGRRVPLSSWENLVVACLACNHRKGARTPAQAQMPLRAWPRRPTLHDAVRILFARVHVEAPWVAYLPEGTGLLRDGLQAA